MNPETQEITSKKWNSHGPGDDRDFRRLGEGVVIEDGVRVFLARYVEIGDDVYVGHDAIIKGYYDRKLVIGSGTWIGPRCFIYASGDIEIGEHVGIGPGVSIITSQHDIDDSEIPILHSPLRHGRVVIGDGADIGALSVILPGVNIGRGAQIGAGSVVNKDIPDFAVAVGTPARVIRKRK